MNERLKVFFIDDEYLIRKLLNNCVDWHDLGYKVVGESSGGEDAVDQVVQCNPDLIFVDISMPIIGGIELSKRILEVMPRIKIVMLTGHQEFDYAREAVKFGAFDYLLKPVNPKEIIAVADKVKEAVSSRRNHYEMIEQLKQRIEDGYSYLRERFLASLVEGKIDARSSNPSFDYYQIDLEPLHLSIAVIEVYIKDEERIDAGIKELLENMGTVEMFKDYVGDMEQVYHFIKDNSVVVMSNNQEVSLTKLMEGFKESIDFVENIGVTIGISNEISDPNHIRSAYQQALSALAYKVVCGEDTVIEYNELATDQETPLTDDSSIEKMRFFIKAGLLDEAIEQLQIELGIYSITTEFSVDRLRAIGVRIVSECLMVQNEFGITSVDEDKNSGDMITGLLAVKTLPEMEGYLVDLITSLTKKIQGLQRVKGSSIVQDVRTYLDEHMTDSELTLKGVAANFYLNASYLSRIYKQETGYSFIEYIKNKRMEMAVSILSQEDCKAYQVAERVGIDDPHYFGIQFKKHTGMTVSDYKKKLGGDQNEA